MTWSIPFLVPFIFALLAKFFPYQNPDYALSIDYSELKSKYQKWEFFSFIPLFVFLAIMTFLFGNLFSTLFNLTIKKDVTVIYYILPGREATWYIPAGILSFGLIIFPMQTLYILILGRDKYDEYIMFTNLKHGYDGIKIFKPIAWTCGIMSMLLLFLLTDYYIKISNEKIIVNNFLGLSSKTYNFEQINSIEFIEMSINKYGPYPNPHYYIKFEDNSVWNTHSGLRDELHQKEIVDFLSKKAKIQIDTLQLDPE